MAVSIYIYNLIYKDFTMEHLHYGAKPYAEFWKFFTIFSRVVETFYLCQFYQCYYDYHRLNSMSSAFTFRAKVVRVFMSGDYEFLCAMYGITGANGKQNLYWSELHLKRWPTTVSKQLFRSDWMYLSNNHIYIYRSPFLPVLPHNKRSNTECTTGSTLYSKSYLTFARSWPKKL